MLSQIDDAVSVRLNELLTAYLLQDYVCRKCNSVSFHVFYDIFMLSSFRSEETLFPSTVNVVDLIPTLFVLMIYDRMLKLYKKLVKKRDFFDLPNWLIGFCFLVFNIVFYCECGYFSCRYVLW